MQRQSALQMCLYYMPSRLTLLSASMSSSKLRHMISHWSGSMRWQHRIVNNSITPCHKSLSDPVYGLHQSFVATAFLYLNLRQAIRFENGAHIIHLWKMWLLRFWVLGRKAIPPKQPIIAIYICKQMSQSI